MTEKQIQTLMQNLDNDLLVKELDDLMSDLEVDQDSITQKAFNKLNEIGGLASNPPLPEPYKRLVTAYGSPYSKWVIVVSTD